MKRFLIVNDSPMAIAVIKAIVHTNPDYIISWIATTGFEAIDMALKFTPDLILMDIHMPGLNGIDAVKRIMALKPGLRILMISATITRNNKYIFEALKYGAIDFVRTPSLPYKPGRRVSKEQLQRAGRKILHKIKSVLTISENENSFVKKIVNLNNQRPQKNLESLHQRKKEENIFVIGIGASTGGPKTLTIIIKNFPVYLNAAVILCLHIEEGFDEGFAHWINEETGRKVILVKKGTKIEPDTFYICPAGKNLVFKSKKFIGLEAVEKLDFFVPNIDKLFFSMAKYLKSLACGIVLTGMGNDGAKGSKAIKDNGGLIIIQDPKSAIIDSMPKQALKINNIKEGFTLLQIGAFVLNWLGNGN